MSEFGIENLKKVADLPLEMVNVGFGVAESKDWASLTAVLDELMALPSVEWDKLDDELKDMDDAEILAMAAHLADKLELPAEKVEAEGLTKEAIQALAKTGVAVKAWVEFAKKVKK